VKNKILKAGDFFIIIVAVALIVILFTKFFFSRPAEQQVKITGRSSQEYYELNEDRVVEVEGPLGITKVIIEDGEVWVENSPCREKICMRMGRIKRTGDQLICIPNRVVVEIEGDIEYIDAISR
jgi:hypothetical protein